MNYRRVLLLCDLGSDIRGTVSTIRRVAPRAELLLVIAELPARTFGWFSNAAPDEQKDAATGALTALREIARDAAGEVEVRLTPELTSDGLDELALDEEIDLIAAGELSLARLGIVAELRKRRSLAFLRQGNLPPLDRPIRRIVCTAIGSRGVAAVALFLRDHCDESTHASVVVLEDHLPSNHEWLEIMGVKAEVDFVRLGEAASRIWKGDGIASQLDLVVIARFPGALLDAEEGSAPLLVLPPVRSTAPMLRRAIDAPDVVDDGGTIRARFDLAGGIGRREPIPDQQVALVTDGRVAAVVATEGGRVELPNQTGADSFGVYRTTADEIDPLTAIELTIAVLRPGGRPLVLFDAALDDDELATLASMIADVDLLAVRMQALTNCRAIRARLRKRGLPPRVVDASTVLDEGEALDVPDVVDPVRLARVAGRMRAAGFPVVAIVHHGPHVPRTIGFPALSAKEAAGVRWELPALESRSGTLAGRLTITTGAAQIEGNRVEVELDNAKARHWLLESIASARLRVHMQLYMGTDDDVGSLVEAALAAAAARGVTVRVLVDSLHGLHGSLGATNPLFARLAARPGVELRVISPITGAPSLEELKQRDHRKVVVVDGTLALLGGRNLAHEYYTGFHEVALSPDSLWREVPWLDAGARVEGPAVTALDRAFLETWIASGGAPFEVIESPLRSALHPGDTTVRVIVHQGLRDAFTLEAYLALIETAQSHVYAVNGFPLILEIQNALLRALRRGLRVCTLFGNLTPTHDGKPFEGPWATARLAATELVHSRMDALVAAGAEGYRFVVPEQPSWSGKLGPVSPHVHAKVMSVDGRACAVGSANLDITAGYWESELLLVIEDPAVAGGLEARIDALLASSARVDREDASWQEMARRRGWMRHWPGVLSV